MTLWQAHNTGRPSQHLTGSACHGTKDQSLVALLSPLKFRVLIWNLEESLQQADSLQEFSCMVFGVVSTKHNIATLLIFRRSLLASGLNLDTPGIRLKPHQMC